MNTTRPSPRSTGRPARRAARGAGFTLVELILVMVMLLIVLSLAAPSLSRFFRGRQLDSEAQRLLALTRYGQNRAVSEGVPMMLWLDPELGTYGLQIDPTFTTEDTNAVEFVGHEDIEIEVGTADSATNAGPWSATTRLSEQRPALRFLPDGSISETSPSRLRLREVREDSERSDGEQDGIWITQSRSRLRYEISTNTPTNFQR